MSRSSLKFQPLEKDLALTILNWRYPFPYNCYNFDPNTISEDLCNLLDRENCFYAIVNSLGELEGYCSFGADGRVPGGDYRDEALDVGMGIRPDLMGQKRGEQYAQAVMNYAIERYRIQKLRVKIAQFNKRAQRVWKKLGFQPVDEFAKIGNGEKFVILTRLI